MATTYDHETFSKEITAALNAESRKLVEFAVLGCGWKCILTSKNTVTVQSPVRPDVKIHFGGSTKSSGRARTHRAKIVKYGDPVRMGLTRAAAEGTAGVDTNVTADVEFQRNEDQLRSQRGHRLSVTPWPSPDAQGNVGAWHCSCGASGASKDPTADANEHAANSPVPERPEESVHRTRRVVSQTPLLVHKNLTKSRGGESYPSRSTDERRWSDGTVDYVCRYEGCDVVRDKAVKVTRHFASAHVRHGDLPPQKGYEPPTVEDPSYTEHAFTRTYTPRADRVEALRKFLTENCPVDATFEQLAEAALQWVHEQSDRQGTLAAEREPLTPEQVIDRIRNLVDRGEYVDMRNELEAARLEAEQYRAKAEVAEQAFEAERAARRAMGENLDALSDMIRDLRGEKS